jgi:hypothetical protein
MGSSPTIMLQEANARVWNVNIRQQQSKRSSKLNHPQKIQYFSFFFFFVMQNGQFWNTANRRAQNYSEMLQD